MKITTDKTDYLLVAAGDSRCSGTDFAIVKTDSLCSTPERKEILLNDKQEPDVSQWYCTYLEVKKLSNELYRFIEATQIDEWTFRYIDEELHEELLKHCEIETGDYGSPQRFGAGIVFELYDEVSTEGCYMRFCTDIIPFDALK